MDINRARALKAGDVVSCPPDRGSPGYTGRVTFIQADATAQKTIQGTPYIWITVQASVFSHREVWPSNRLG